MEPAPTRRSFIAVAAGAVVANALPSTGTKAAASAPADWGYRGAGQLVQALADRKVSSRELVEAAIARIEGSIRRSTRS